MNDVAEALNELKGCRELTHRLPVATDNTEPFSLSAVLGRVVVGLDSHSPQYFADGRKIVLDAINSVRDSPPSYSRTSICFW